MCITLIIKQNNNTIHMSINMKSIKVNLLSANPPKSLNTLKQFVGKLFKCV